MDLISILVVLFATMLAGVAGVYAYGMSNLREIKQNWVQYRCNPLYMPLAGMVGSDIVSNFTNCSMQSTQSYAGFVMDPIFQNFSSIQEVFGSVLGSINFIRQKIAGTVDGFLGMVNSVFGKLQNTLGVTSQLVGRFRTIMNRIVSVFVILLHIANTGTATGESINNGPIGKAAEFFCFEPTTLMQMEDGTHSLLRDVRVGSVLFGGHKVESVLTFDGTRTPMVDLVGIQLSGNHKVLYNDKWIRAEKHPHVIPAKSVRRLICLNTDTHQIPIMNFMFKDYEETDDIEVFNKRVGEYYLSDPPDRSKYKVSGFHSSTFVVLANSEFKRIKDIEIGDKLLGGQAVIGKVVHKIEAPFVDKDGVFMAPGTVCRNFDGLHIAAEIGYESSEVKDALCYQLLTETAQFVVMTADFRYIMVLDDQEVPSYAIHSERDSGILCEKITKL